MAEQQGAEAARTPGATRAGSGDYVFELAKLNNILGGPAYSTANGTCVEGDRMMVALMRMPAGTGAEAHSHPNEQWIYILEGTFVGEIAGKSFEAQAGTAVYVPSGTVHSGKATPRRPPGLQPSHGGGRTVAPRPKPRLHSPRPSSKPKPRQNP